MYAKYGDYQHANNEVYVQAMRRDGLFVNGMSRGYVQQMQIAGQLHAATPSLLTAAMDALATAYSVNGRDFAIYEDGGTLTHLALLSSNCLGGVRIIQRPSFAEVRGGQYTTYVDYTLGLEGEVPDTSCQLLAWEESFEFTGGGPEFVFLEPILGLAQKQMVKQATVYRAAQVGSAVGYFGYPFFFIPSPRWPDNYLPRESSSGISSADRDGPAGQPTRKGFPVRWSFQFASVTPFFGVPGQWPI
jgi:hypothetical protein